MYSKVRVVPENNVVILFYSLVYIIYSDGYSVSLMVKRVPIAIPLILNGINDFLANIWAIPVWGGYLSYKESAHVM
jgi:hypothetical protein